MGDARSRMTVPEALCGGCGFGSSGAESARSHVLHCAPGVGSRHCAACCASAIRIAATPNAPHRSMH
eukprot:2550002-Prymnesium_polylepis.1